jgi:hypothetical protein
VTSSAASIAHRQTRGISVGDGASGGDRPAHSANGLSRPVVVGDSCRSNPVNITRKARAPFNLEA